MVVPAVTGESSTKPAALIAPVVLVLREADRMDISPLKEVLVVVKVQPLFTTAAAVAPRVN
jgi:hypothetical protein